jgi:hypothetical protein
MAASPEFKKMIKFLHETPVYQMAAACIEDVVFLALCSNGRHTTPFVHSVIVEVLNS